VQRARDISRDAVPKRGDIGRRLYEALRDNSLYVRSSERRLSGEHLVEHAAERVLVAASVDGFTRRLFRADVRRRPHSHACLRHSRFARCADRLADAEVGDEHVTVLQQNVLGFHVAVHDPLLVRVRQCLRRCGGDAHRIFHWNPRLTRESVAQRLAAHHRHHIVENSCRLS
jgi:hypothetical protein